MRAHRIPDALCMPVLQGLSQLQQADLAIGDVKPSNTMVDVSKLAGGQGPLAKLIDYGCATNGITSLLAWHCVSVWGMGKKGASGARKGVVIHGRRQIPCQETLCQAAALNHWTVHDPLWL